jgi:uncharacterized protein (DUF2147 family)
MTHIGVLGTSLACLAAMSFSAMAADPDGIWFRNDGNAKVKIAPCGEQLCATNLWIGDTRKGEEVGDKLIMTLRRQSETELVGKAYDPKRDRTYSMTLIVEQARLVTRGCILGGLLCKDVIWTPTQ